MKIIILSILLTYIHCLAHASEAAFTATANKLKSVQTTKEREQILFDFYAELNKMISEIEKKEDPNLDPNYAPLLESLVFYEILMDRHNAVKLTENRSCKDYKFFIDARIDPRAEAGVPEEKYSLAAKWFQTLIQSICK
jgi:hypothetical protein